MGKPVFVAVSYLLALLLTGCGQHPWASDRSRAAELPPSLVAFPQLSHPSEVSMQALLEGLLIVQGGCLRVSPDGVQPGHLILWPPAYTPRERVGALEVLDGEGAVAVTLGDRVFMSGGEIPAASAAQMPLRAPLPEDCPGPSWLLAESGLLGSALPFTELMEHAPDYDGDRVCTRGIYLSGFEASTLGEGIYEKGGFTYLREPTVWVEGALISREDDCDSVQGYAFCPALVCGQFKVCPEGCGHLGGFAFQLSSLPQ